MLLPRLVTVLRCTPPHLALLLGRSPILPRTAAARSARAVRQNMGDAARGKQASIANFFGGGASAKRTAATQAQGEHAAAEPGALRLRLRARVGLRDGRVARLAPLHSHALVAVLL